MGLLSTIMYHYIRPISVSRYPGIKGLEYDDFIGQLEYLKKNYTPVTIEDVVGFLQEDVKNLPKNAVLLTFDDAYIDHFKYAYPALKKFGMQGSFYAPVKAVTERVLLDVNKIHFTLAACSDTKILLSDFVQEFNKLKSGYDLESFESYYSKYAVANRFDNADVIFIKRALQVALPEDVRGIISDNLFEKYVGLDEHAFCEELYMTSEHLEHMVNDGMHVGSHGYDHYWWNQLAEEKLDTEISKSKSFLNGIGADKNALTACYPYGSWSEDAIKKLIELDFDLAFTTEVDLAKVSSESRFLIPRLDTNDIPKSEKLDKNSWHPDFYLK
jgi:peptidoglycan/xylan/chitin deacetylase (PgdA/CDA1 family)